MHRRTIVFAVTADISVALLGKVPLLLAREGWDVHVVASPGTNLSRLHLSGLISCHPIKMSRNPKFWSDLLGLFRWILVLIEVRPHVISVGTPKASLLGMLSAAALGVKHRIYILRGLRLETEKGLVRLMLWLFEKVVAGLATEIIAVSRSLEKTYISERLCKPGKVRVLGFGASIGVNLSLFRPASAEETPALLDFAAARGLNPEVPIVGFVGRQHLDKGIGLLAEAVKAQPLADIEFQLLLIGNDESEGFLGRVLSRSPKKIVFVDECDREEVALFYRLMTVLCHPSQREGLPNVVLEALASGTPVVVTKATGSVDAAEAGVNGLIVNKNSSLDLSVALARVISEPKLRKSLASHARDWVSDRFAETSVSANYIAFYRELSEKRKPALSCFIGNQQKR